jgi:hypothetical protein
MDPATSAQNQRPVPTLPRGGKRLYLHGPLLASPEQEIKRPCFQQSILSSSASSYSSPTVQQSSVLPNRVSTASSLRVPWPASHPTGNSAASSSRLLPRQPPNITTLQPGVLQQQSFTYPTGNFAASPSRPLPRQLLVTQTSRARIRRKFSHLSPTKSPVQLVQAYEQRCRASTLFPPEISDSCVRDRISHFEDHIAAAIAATQKICGSCGRFIEQEIFQLSKDNPLLKPFYTGPGSSPRLDACALDQNDYLFCHPCFKQIQRRCPPKYSALNGVNVTFCQDYPSVLRDLTLTEECLIARSHPIASILKLRPNSARKSTAYNRLRGHVIVLPQNPGPLLDILPSAEIKLHEKIKVVWFGDRTPTAEDLRPYLEVRKQVVYHALLWLRLHNKLYSGITVNQHLLDSWAESFIPNDLEDSIVHCEDDREEREGYAADIGVDNCENDLQEALDDQTSDPISTGCVYSDVESTRKCPELLKISAILNLEKERFERCPANSGSGDQAAQYVEDIPVIRYISNGQSVLMNDWQDLEYFTGSFPTLFPVGTGGHLPDPQQQTVSVSLKAWAQWALGHHSRR